MRMPWSKSKSDQLELLDAEPEALSGAPDPDDHRPARPVSSAPSIRSSARAVRGNEGRPLVVALARLFEDPNNPRTEFPESEIDELSDDIRQHGILQAIVVHPADAAGRYRIHFGAKRLRAARRAGLDEVPVVVRDAPADAYAQVAENQKRHGLTPLDLARFIRAKVDEGESNATIAARLGMDPTAVGYHLALLELPPELDDALKSGRCTSPRSLYELSKLHEAQPDRAKALVAGESEITRAAIAAVRAEQTPATIGAGPRSIAGGERTHDATLHPLPTGKGRRAVLAAGRARRAGRWNSRLPASLSVGASCAASRVRWRRAAPALDSARDAASVQWCVLDRDCVHRSKSDQRHATARGPRRTGDGNEPLAIHR